MSVIQLEELVSYQLRTSYLDEIADGVGERLLNVNDGFINSAPFKAAGWRPNSSHHKRTHSPPIPTAIASEYFQAPKQAGLTLEDGEEDGGMLTAGGSDTMGPGMATRRRRRREQMEEEDSSDLSDESDDDTDQRAAQQIKFAKMPVRHRAGSSPLQNTNLRQVGAVSPRAPRRGSQSALVTVQERPRRDTVTSSEISSENETDIPTVQRHREAARAAARAAKLQARILEEPSPGIQRADTSLLPEEEEDSDEASDLSDNYAESIDSASILDGVENAINASPTRQVVGTPPKNFVRQSTIRKSKPPTHPIVLGALPPPRPMSMIRPLSVAQPKSLLSAALKAKDKKSSIPFQKFAHFSGQGTQGSIAEKLEPPLPKGKLNINWWTLRMVEEGGEVDDDFPPFERTKPLTSFTTVNNAAARGGGRMRSNSTAYDDFALAEASEEEYLENKSLTPQEDEEEEPATSQDSGGGVPLTPTEPDADATPRGTPGPAVNPFLAERPRQNPIVTTTYRSNAPPADIPQAPAAAPNTSRGQQKLLRIHIMSSDVAPGQMVTLDVMTDTYLAEVLDMVCRKRQLDKANHVLKLPGSGAVVMLDRPVSSIGNVSDLELYRRRFATDGPLTITGSPGSSSPKMLPLADQAMQKRSKKSQTPMVGSHPLARESLKQDELSNASYKKYTVWRKQPMRIVGMSERILVIDGEYIHIMPASGGKALHDGSGKTTTVHFSNVVGCKVLRKHPTNVKLVVYKATESKRYDFEARSALEAAEIVEELKKGMPK
uniref:Stress-activated map kinase-interacting protein 1 n=1 Tax=Fusarium oxysporum (strain Fo5176) TaxID=660025 RepID=A0A0D2XZL1_FUSOF